MLEDSFYSRLKKHPVFKNFQEDEIKSFFSQSRKISLRPGDSLIKEGEAAGEIFFVLRGTLEAFRYDPIFAQHQQVASFREGDIVGEMAVLDKGTRSANVVAVTDAEVVAVSIAGWETDRSTSFYKILFFLAENLSTKLRNSNISSLEKQVEEYKKRVLCSHVFFSVLFFICLIFYLQSGLEFLNLTPLLTYLTLPLTCGFMASMFYIVKKFRLPWKTFGLTTLNWRASVKEALLFTLPLLGLLLLVKWSLIRENWISYQPLFSWNFPLFDITAYPLIIIPLQELVVRGGLQGTLMEIVLGKHQKLIAIGVSSIAFGAGHLFLSFPLSVAALLSSFYLGWLYSRNPNLIGVCIAHILLGIGTINIIGF